MGDDIPAGVRGLKFATLVAKPSCGPPLAELGAELNTVEPPKGDYIRRAA
ncbi:MAG: CoA transferase [Deltaproteobacteria bacterium]|nr:CoA transferase [Deltaproteobacteria bacterium]